MTHTSRGVKIYIRM